MTDLDLIRAHDPLTRLRSIGFWPDLTWNFYAWKSDIQDDRGLRFLPTVIQPDLGEYDLLLVPGGN